MKLRYKHIAIEGNIGAGKTTLAKLLAASLNAELLLEQFEENDFLQDFYQNKKFALHAEIQFLLDRSKQLFLFHRSTYPVIVSDYIPEKSLLFSKMNLTTKEFQLVKELMHSIFDAIPKPDILIYLNRPISELEANIKKRGRSYEAAISPEYLIDLNKAYSAFLENIYDIPVLQVNANEINLEHPEHVTNQFEEILSKEHNPGIKRIYLDKNSQQTV